MRIRNSLQRRVFAAFGAFTFLLCLVYTGICVLAAYVVEDQVLDNLLADEADYIEQQFLASGELPRPRLPYMDLYPDSDVAPTAIRAALPQGATRAEWFSKGERHFHLRRLNLNENTAPILAAEVGRLLTVSRQSGNLLWLIFATLLATSALALWTAYRLAAGTIGPVITLAEEVKRQQHGDAPLSLAASSAGDEIGFLARTLESALNQLKLALQRESEFTRDVSHELRTAITIAKNTLVLSRHRDLSAQEREQLHSALAEMERTVSALLALGRAESIEQAPFELRALLEKRLLARHRGMEEMQFRVRLDLRDGQRAIGNRQLATLLVDNLLDNAIRHAARPELRIYADGEALVFENPVAEAFDADESLRPGQKSEQSDGIGQGLFLVKRILVTLKWDFAVHCSDGLFRCAVYPRRCRGD